MCICPADRTYNRKDRPARGCYAANYLVFKEGSQRLDDMKDGRANTIMVTERLAECGYGPDGEPNFTAWMWWKWDLHTPMFAFYSSGPGSKFVSAASADECDPRRPASPHGKLGIGVAMGDASVRMVSPGVSATTWWAACTPDAADRLGDDW
jgi:hypothetical protein